jgi:protein phosphatase
MLVDEGRITEVEANTHPQKSLLMRALDGRDTDAEYSLRQVVAGDRYLLCSDGLSGVVSAETIAATMREYADPHQCSDRLVQLALRAGGPDNITVVVADFTDADIVEAAPIVAGAAANDRGMITTADISTPAGRASALTQPRTAGPVPGTVDDEAPRRRHPVRATLILLLIAALLGGGLYGGWRYTQTKYYVGVTDDGWVAIFQGIPGQVAGFQLSEVVPGTQTVKIDDLTPAAQEKVRATIVKASYADAVLARDALLSPDSGNVVPVCQTITVYPTPPPTTASAVVGSVGPTTSANPTATGVDPSATGVNASATGSAPASPTPSGTVTVTPSPCRPPGS